MIQAFLGDRRHARRSGNTHGYLQGGQLFHQGRGSGTFLDFRAKTIEDSLLLVPHIVPMRSVAQAPVPLGVLNHHGHPFITPLAQCRLLDFPGQPVLIGLSDSGRNVQRFVNGHVRQRFRVE